MQRSGSTGSSGVHQSGSRWQRHQECMCCNNEESEVELLHMHHQPAGRKQLVCGYCGSASLPEVTGHAAWCGEDSTTTLTEAAAQQTGHPEWQAFRGLPHRVAAALLACSAGNGYDAAGHHMFSACCVCEVAAGSNLRCISCCRAIMRQRPIQLRHAGSAVQLLLCSCGLDCARKCIRCW